MIKFNQGQISIYLLVYTISGIILFTLDVLKLQFFLYLYFINVYIEQLGQIIGGLSIYLYQKRAFYKKKHIKYFFLKIIYNKANIKSKYKKFKILILIFFASVFGFFSVVFEQHYSTQIPKISRYFKVRIGGITSIVSSILCTCSLNFKFGKHHKFSLIFMSVFLIIEIILEIYFLKRAQNILIRRLIFELFLNIFRVVIVSFIDCIMKYLYEIYYVNPFKILIIEGIVKFLFIIIFTFSKNFFEIEKLKNFFVKDNSGKICGFIFLLLGNLLVSVIMRVYQIYCNVIFSPTIKSLADYIAIPLYNILSFTTKQDFYSNITHFVICEIFSIIIDFFGCVYNEFIVLFGCGLEHDTKLDISSRAELSINNPKNLSLNDIQIEENNSERTNTEIFVFYS